MTSKLPQGIRKHSSGVGYEIRISFKDAYSDKSRRISRYTKTLSEAKALQRQLLAELNNNRTIPSGKETFGFWASKWSEQILPTLGLKKSTQRLYSNLLKSHLQECSLATKRLRAVTPLDINRLFYEEASQLSASTRRNLFNVISKIFQSAQLAGLVSSSPTRDGATRPRQDRRESRFLTHSEVQLILEEMATSRHRGPIELISKTGLRRGEALALSWDDVDLAQRKIRIRFTLNSEGERTPPKSARSVRTLDISDSVYLLLKREKELQGLNKMRLGELWVGNDWDLVFTTDNGRMVNPRNLLKSLKRASVRIGLEEHPLGGVTVHTLRHYVATHLLNNGVEITTVSRILGHESIQTTVDLYGHLLDESRKKALNLL